MDHSCKIDASSEINQNSPMFRKLNLLVEIPSEINAARVSRQQFTSNAATAFLPMVQNGDPLSLETGPHWAQLIPDLGQQKRCPGLFHPGSLPHADQSCHAGTLAITKQSHILRQGTASVSGSDSRTH